MNIQPVITLDIDWTADYSIDFAASLLIEAQVRATWFVTYDSPAVERLCQRLLELCIRPDFPPYTTHGNTELEILSHYMGLPQARVVRTHGLIQTSSLLKKIIDETAISVDGTLTKRTAICKSIRTRLN